MKRTTWIVPIISILFAGCATNMTKPSGIPQASKVKFSEFAKVEMKPLAINEKFAESGANQKARRKIEGNLKNQVKTIFSNCTFLGENQEFSKTSDKTLQIVPTIKEIKFIGGAARIWVGAMAGSSAVLMEVICKDSKSSEIVAQAEFYQEANAFSGAYSMGGTDNMMLDQVSLDVAKWLVANK